MFCVYKMCEFVLIQNQPPTKKRVLPAYRSKYGPEQINRAYDMWKDEGVSVYKAAKTCGIPVVTLRDRTTLGHCNPYKYKSGPSHLLSSTEEAALVAHVKDIAACGYGYTRRELAELAGETALVAHVKDIAACGYGYTRRELAELAGETALVAHVKDIAACGYGYTRRELAELAGETALVAHVKDIAACGYGYTRRELAELAGETAFFLNKRDTSVPITR